MHYPYGYRFRQLPKKQPNFSSLNCSNGLTIEDFIKNCRSYKPQKKKIDKYIFAFQDFIGKGNFANVYKGINTHTSQPVAIKVMEMKCIAQKKLYCLLQAEMEIFKSLRHNNILKCYDVLVTDNNCYVITQYCEQGDLQSFFSKSRLKQIQNNKEQQVEEQFESIVFDIYQGLLYLQRKNIIHRDIKMSNILVKDGTAKIADFGFASFSKNKFQDVTIGSPVYMSPQSLIHGIYGPKTDVWAFGILLYQIFHSKTPFDHCKSTPQLIQNLKIPFKRQKIQQNLPQKLKNLILKCLSINEEQRSTFRQLWMDQYIWELRNKFRPSIKEKQKQSSLKSSNQNFKSAITNSSTLCCTQIQQPKKQKNENSKDFELQMQQFYKLAQQMNKRQQMESLTKTKTEKKQQQKLIEQKICQNQSQTVNLAQKFSSSTIQKAMPNTQISEEQTNCNNKITTFPVIKKQYTLIKQKTVNFKVILYFLQLYRLLNKLIINLVNIEIDFNDHKQNNYQLKFSQEQNLQTKFNLDSHYSKKFQEVIISLYEVQKDQNLELNQKNKEAKIENILKYAKIILKEIRFKIQQNNIKYDIQAESWLKQKKILSLITQYNQNLQIQVQKYEQKKIQLFSALNNSKQLLIGSKKKIRREKSIYQKSQSSSNKSKSDKNQQKIEVNQSFFNLKDTISTFLELLKKIQIPLTQFSDSQFKISSQNEIESKQNQKQEVKQQKIINYDEQNERNQVMKLATIGNILALIYIQSKRISILNLRYQKVAVSNKNLNIKKVEEFESETLLKSEKEIQDFLLLESKQISSLDMFFQYMYEIQLQILHQKQGQDNLSKN